MPKVSIAITTKDRSHWLPLAIESILTQTFPDWELVLWDDGSTDGTLEICEEYAERYQQIRCYSGDLGRPAALNAAIAETSGEYLGWMDDDDLLTPNALALTVAALDQEPETGLVYTNYRDMTVDGVVGQIGHRCQIPYSRDGLLVDFMAFQLRLFRRGLWDLLGGIDVNYPIAQDYDFVLKASEVVLFSHIPETCYFYRIHKNSISRAQTEKQRNYSAQAVRAAIKRRGLPYRLEAKNGFHRLYTLFNHD
jgi:glycosyltransferase involved in cell wall biosynthesis